MIDGNRLGFWIMAASDEEIENIVKWRMGSAYGKRILDWRSSSMNFDTAQGLDAAYAGGLTIDGSGANISPPSQRSDSQPARHVRVNNVAEDLATVQSRLNIPLSIFVAMNDARLFPSLAYVGPGTSPAPIQLSYNRPVEEYWRATAEIILWPLSGQWRTWQLPNLQMVPWEQRASDIFWRGQPTGISYVLSEGARPILTGLSRMRPMLLNWLKEETSRDEECFNQWKGTYQRLIAVGRNSKAEGIDARLIPSWAGEERPLHVVRAFLGADSVSERLDWKTYRTERYRRRYVLAIPGNDCPSSLREDLLSGGLLLMPKPFWETYWFYGLKPDIHYVALRADLSDLEERLQWCRDNDTLCREMAENARNFAMNLFGPELETEVQSRMFQLISTCTMVET